MNNKVYGYIRVSTQEQNIERQMIALLDAGMDTKDIYIDKQSGKNFKRPAYVRMMRRVREGDLIIVKSIDRLGRNYQEIMEQWRVITKEKKVDIRILDMPLLDTTRTKDLLGTFISDVVLQLLSFVAENERNNIRQRQAEGIAAAKARGIRFGKPKIPMPDNFQELYQQWEMDYISTEDFAALCHVGRSTLYKRIREYRELIHFED
ncbi:recombinase family protein [Lachnospiraceae bacterium WCA-9-b2]|jgi:DNA invertase Pin-like site-specific DNA recombinase|uniref:Recombinase family protein n=1 Tax=Sporofaciens musculi TaxID=2681861 RepID=A0A7X3MCL6_9FIRM|nr:recombinase family protein [Sporofaciens musculi]MXP73924.1 recombinase family protein [Sporofaciens musculi]